MAWGGWIMLKETQPYSKAANCQTIGRKFS